MSAEHSNSYTSKTLRLESRSFQRSSEWGESMPMGVGYAEHVPSRGMWASLEVSSGQILNTEA
ncbi:MAG: hypothetical protein AB7E47_02025 [Desulfovibrionaceae bacterium]